MKSKYIKIGLIICFFLLTGKSYEASENKLSFTPVVKQTENKMDDSTTDIKLKGKAGESVDLWVTVTNESDQPLNMVAEIKDSGTNNQGIIQYASDQKVLNDEFSLKKISNYKEEFLLKAKEKRDIKVKIKLPDKKFEGILLGGLNLKQEADKDSEEQIKNSFSYSIPVVIVESEDLIDANLSFDSVMPELTGGKNALKVNVNNPKNILLPNADYSVSVRKKDSEKVLYHDELKDVTFAPNNQFSHYVLMAKDSYEAGTYVADIRVTSPYGDWKFKEEFTIDKKIANKLNDESISIQRMSPLLKGLIIGCIVLITVVISLLVYLVKVKRSTK